VLHRGEGVADAGLPDVLHAGDDVADLAGRQELGRLHVGADDADLEDLVGVLRRHHQAAVLGRQLPSKTRT
jgi:hypothetical protein